MYVFSNDNVVVLDEASKIKEIAQQGDGQLKKPFKLGLIYSIAPYLLPLIIPLLRKSAPDMPLEIEENITKILEEKLKKGAIDAAIVALPFDIPGVEVVDYRNRGRRRTGRYRSATRSRD